MAYIANYFLVGIGSYYSGYIDIALIVSVRRDFLQTRQSQIRRGLRDRKPMTDLFNDLPSPFQVYRSGSCWLSIREPTKVYQIKVPVFGVLPPRLQVVDTSCKQVCRRTNVILLKVFLASVVSYRLDNAVKVEFLYSLLRFWGY